MIIIMGVTGAGKSYFINRLAGREVVQEGADLDSCTQACQLIPITIGASKVLLIDTPGFDDTQRTDSEILTEIARILSCQYQLGVDLKGVIYIHRITDIRYSRSSVKTFEVFKKICGERALKNVLLITSRWGEVSQSIGSDRERQLKDRFWAYMLGRGSNISRFYGDRDSAIGLISQLLMKETAVLELQEELVDNGKRLSETSAGAYVSNNIDDMKKRYEEELASLEKLKLELRANDRAMKRQIQRDWEEEQLRLEKAQKEQVSLQRPVGTEVQEEIKKKRFKLSLLIPFIPSAISIMCMFVGIPPGVSGIFTSWMGIDDPGSDFSLSDLLSF
ncbi:P-loop containing nucleoside triphosphate hydrolase protein [Mytilinidion resinicola]|uniref:P-loop containing nucleoside triphosphate hydrolase protein n=1 Tax=Mytilinidion resinicola TaxID=574789 RepID=A0A6A6Z2Y1_9PEZI|nr:P-loop containing nucleoside triphosphate hydrolase protein [Mytilinidion resinicola]KAF2815178.1 P-loop containing nucleoside triphosphate hydrolase protein [Mytilinidion resinicola]